MRCKLKNKTHVYISTENVTGKIYTTCDRNVCIQTSSLPMEFLTAGLTGEEDVWMQRSQSTHVYSLPLILSILIYKYDLFFNLHFITYQQHCYILNMYYICVTCALWRRPQKIAETCISYLDIWTSAIRGKSIYLLMLHPNLSWDAGYSELFPDFTQAFHYDITITRSPPSKYFLTYHLSLYQRQQLFFSKEHKTYYLRAKFIRI